MAVNLALIGCGYWGPNYARNFSEIEGCRLKWICDIDRARLDRFKNRYPNVNATTDFLDILNDKDTHAVVISTPSTKHYKLAKEALSAGKHVLVEKPLCISSKECLDLIRLVKEKNKILMVGHTFLYNPAITKLKEYIEKKEIGDLLYLHSSRTGLGPIRTDVNVMWDLASHDISILLYLMDKKPLNVIAKGECYIQKDKEDVVFLTIEFEGKVFANVHVSWLDPIKIRTLTVVGTRKMVVFDDVDPTEKIRLFDKGVSYEKPYSDFGGFQLLVRDGDITVPKLDMKEPLKVQCLHFLDSIENDEKPLTDGINGYKVVKVLEAATESLRNNSKSVNIHFEDDIE